MSNIEERCRCCYSSEGLKTLCRPELDVYTLICNTQAVYNEDIQMLTCHRCCELLKQIYRFRIEYQPFDAKSSQLNIKTEPIDEYNDIDHVDLQINEVEIETLLECDKCSFKCKNKHNLIAHQVLHSKRKLIILLNRCDEMLVCSEAYKMKQSIDCVKPYKCNECSFETAKKYRLLYHHKRKHSDETPFECDQCDYRSKLKVDLTYHKRTHSDKPFKCTECSYETIKVYHLKVHIQRKHSDEKPFRCDQCDYSTNMENNLYHHKKSHLTNKPFKCTECSYETVHSRQLSLHVKRRHSDSKLFSCNQCNYATNLKRDLNRHEMVHLKDDDKPYKCDLCNYATTRSTDLNYHIGRKHSGDKPFHCDQCNYCTNMEKDLNKHKMCHMKGYEKPYKCSECSYTTLYPGTLNIHVTRKHGGDKPFRCDECNYCTNIEKDLDRHKLCHLKANDKPYKCAECSYTTRYVNNLNTHVRRKHCDDKPIQCDQCNYCTNIERDLIRHKMAHSKNSDMPYKCTECTYATTTLGYLKKHTKRRHIEQTFTCEHCDYRGKQKEDLFDHMKTHEMNVHINQPCID